jgi:hypothetical protein
MKKEIEVNNKFLKVMKDETKDYLFKNRLKCEKLELIDERNISIFEILSKELILLEQKYSNPAKEIK